MEPKQFAFALTHPQDRTFFVLNAVVARLAIVMGFRPAFLATFPEPPPFPPPIVHVHAVVFTGWLALFTAQIWMIRSRRVDIHRRLGLLGALMVPVVLIVGMVANFVTQRIHLQAEALEPGFFILAIVDMLRFTCLAGAGLLLRRHSAAHKRLLLLATFACLMQAMVDGRTNGSSPNSEITQSAFSVNCSSS